MKSIQYSLLGLLILILLSGCSTYSWIVSYESTNEEQIDEYVKKVEQALHKCYYRAPSEISPLIPIDVIREDYYNPRYSKIKVVYPSDWSYIYLSVLYVIEQEKTNKIIVTDIKGEPIGVPNLKKFIEKNMECK